MRMTEVFIEVEAKILEHLPYCECMEELMDRLMASSVAKYGREMMMPLVEEIWFEHCS